MSDLLITGARDPRDGSPTTLRIRADRVAGDTGEAAARRVDADGLWLAPGFIDLQLNGAFGHDFSSEPAAIWSVGESLAATGVSAFLPTLISSPAVAYERALASWAEPPPAPRGAQPLGWHFEGPMLSPARAGAHDPAHLRLPADVDARSWRASGGVRMVTLAPELPGGQEVATQLFAEGVVVAAGHTDADAACAPAAVDAGVRHATHLLNAMRGLEAREPGIATGLLLDERVTIGLILDGHHLAPATIALVWRAAGSSRVVVTTDGIAALGIGAGPHRLGDRDVVVGDDGGARLGDGRLAGAVVTLPQALRNLRAATDCTLAEALATVTRAPARVLALEDRGHLRPGARADAVLLDDDLQPVATFVGGDPAHGAEALRWA